MIGLTSEQLDMINRLQSFFKLRMGGLREGDFFFSIKPDLVYTHNIDMLNISCDISHIPKPFDWQNPERGLWGMVDWNKFHQELYGPDGDIAIYKVPFIEYNEEMGIPVKDHPLIVSDPFTALLKTLCEQEGV
jgi:hypothetical protein